MMVGMYGILGVPGPASTSQPRVRGRLNDTSSSAPQDRVLFSSQAQEASRAAQILEQSSAKSAARAEQVAKAKQSIENGTYKMQGVVRIVAARVSKYVYEDI